MVNFNRSRAERVVRCWVDRIDAAKFKQVGSSTDDGPRPVKGLFSRVELSGEVVEVVCPG